jgi:hypothetical protein
LAPLLVPVKAQHPDVYLPKAFSTFRQGLVVQTGLWQLRLLGDWWWLGCVVLGQIFELRGILIFNRQLLLGVHRGLPIIIILCTIFLTIILSTITIFWRFTSLGGL